MIVCLYVNDLAYTGNDNVLLNHFKQLMMAEFHMSNLSLMHYLLSTLVEFYLTKEIYLGYFKEIWSNKLCHHTSRDGAED